MLNGDNEEYQSLLAGTGATCEITYVDNGKSPETKIPVKLHQTVEDAAKQFLEASSGDVCILLAGKLQSEFDGEENSTEHAVLQHCLRVLGDPGDEGYSRDRTIDLVLDTLGGSLDSAFRIALYLSQFTSKLRVYVPRRAKSAGTLIAIGAQELYLAPFAELGPLDTQIPDPRDPTHNISALDCFKSVDYVRGFGIDTMKRALIALAKEVETGLPLSDLLNTATSFANSCTGSLLANMRVLDFGGWGRTLQIGERYAKYLLERSGYDSAKAKSLSYKLVYGYTHHPYAINIHEARDLGIRVQVMKSAVSGPALKMVDECADLKIAVGVWEARERNLKGRRVKEAKEPKGHGGKYEGHKDETETDRKDKNLVGVNPGKPVEGKVDILRSSSGR